VRQHPLDLVITDLRMPGGDGLSLLSAIQSEPGRKPRVILCTAKDKADRIHERAEADIDLASGIAFGACRLPNDAGLTSKCWAAGPRK